MSLTPNIHSFDSYSHSYKVSRKKILPRFVLLLIFIIMNIYEYDEGVLQQILFTVYRPIIGKCRYVTFLLKHVLTCFIIKPNVFKFVQLLSVHNTHDLCNLGRYILHLSQENVFFLNVILHQKLSPLPYPFILMYYLLLYVCDEMYVLSK